jgi:hypothetical protein
LLHIDFNISMKLHLNMQMSVQYFMQIRKFYADEVCHDMQMSSSHGYFVTMLVIHIIKNMSAFNVQNILYCFYEYVHLLLLLSCSKLVMSYPQL